MASLALAPEAGVPLGRPLHIVNAA